MTALPTARYPLIDVLKVLAAQFIVLHHFSFYGPVSEALHAAWPGLLGVLYEHGRIAVQVFFVVGGYLAARSLSSATGAWHAPGGAIFKRYIRLLVPYLFALFIVVLCMAWVRPWLSADLAAPFPDWWQWLAHMAMAQSIWGVESLSAGVWYVAMDFQLFALLTLLLWLCGGGHSRRAQTAVALLCAASLLLFNRQSELDAWAMYFFGAYGLGALAWWARRTEPSSTPTTPAWYARALLVGTLALGLLALAIDFRSRVALAIGVTVVLVLWGSAAQHPQTSQGTTLRVMETLSLQSYALFLVHFPVLLLVNAAFTRFGFTPETASATSALNWGIAGWATSLWAANLFHRWIESPAAPWRGALRGVVGWH
ncbi:MAG: acyltransferase family protein [Polaromonas sp.]|nr:acyltransferase family protein [Polaromonas sp.]